MITSLRQTKIWKKKENEAKRNNFSIQVLYFWMNWAKGTQL